MEMRKCIRQEFSTTIGLKYEWSVVENKKIISGKINSNAPLATAILRQGKIKNIWSPVFYTQEVLNQNHATDLLHEMVNFKNQQNFTAVLVKQKKQWSNTTQFFTLFSLV